MGDGRWEMGDGRWEMGDGRWEMGDGRGRRSTMTIKQLKTHRHKYCIQILFTWFLVFIVSHSVTISRKGDCWPLHDILCTSFILNCGFTK